MQILHNNEQRVRSNVVTLQQKNKTEVFDIRNDGYKFEYVLRAKAMLSFKKVDSHDVSLSFGILR